MTKFAEKFEKPLRLIGKIPLTDIDLGIYIYIYI